VGSVAMNENRAPSMLPKAGALQPDRSPEGKRRADGQPPSWLRGGGEMGELIRSTDWSKTLLGSVEGWPQSLRPCSVSCWAADFRCCSGGGQISSTSTTTRTGRSCATSIRRPSPRPPLRFGRRFGRSPGRWREAYSPEDQLRGRRISNSSSTAARCWKKPTSPFPTARCRTMTEALAACSTPCKRRPPRCRESGRSGCCTIWPPALRRRRPRTRRTESPPT
jgi:hypothetical protein